MRRRRPRYAPVTPRRSAEVTSILSTPLPKLAISFRFSPDWAIMWALMTSVMVGTQGDRQAKANTVSRPDRYHAFFRYVLWSHADVFLREINTFAARLKDVRYWRVNSMQG